METNPEKPHINVDYFEDLTEQIDDNACDAVESGQADIGQRIRAIRESKGLTLEKLSHMTGFDVAAEIIHTLRWPIGLTVGVFFAMGMISLGRWIYLTWLLAKKTWGND